jgi:hypothetical protein
MKDSEILDRISPSGTTQCFKTKTKGVEPIFGESIVLPCWVVKRLRKAMMKNVEVKHE